MTSLTSPSVMRALLKKGTVLGQVLDSNKLRNILNIVMPGEKLHKKILMSIQF